MVRRQSVVHVSVSVSVSATPHPTCATEEFNLGYIFINYYIGLVLVIKNTFFLSETSAGAGQFQEELQCS